MSTINTENATTARATSIADAIDSYIADNIEHTVGRVRSDRESAAKPVPVEIEDEDTGERVTVLAPGYNLYGNESDENVAARILYVFKLVELRRTESDAVLLEVNRLMINRH